mgnify:CR=1 FL=1
MKCHTSSNIIHRTPPRSHITSITSITIITVVSDSSVITVISGITALVIGVGAVIVIEFVY